MCVGSTQSILWGPEQDEEAKEGQILFPLELGTFSCSWTSASRACVLWDLDQQPPGSKAFGLGLSYANSFPGSPVYKQ